jgi:hypothetical protein
VGQAFLPAFFLGGQAGMPASPETKLGLYQLLTSRSGNCSINMEGANRVSCPRVLKRRVALQPTRRAGEALHHEEQREENRDESQSRGSLAQNHREPAQNHREPAHFGVRLQEFSFEWSSFSP